MWFNILKMRDIRNLSDAKRMAQDYLPEELYNNMLISEEEYQELPDRDKLKLHYKLYSYLTKRGKENLSPELKEKIPFHRKMQGRLEKKSGFYTSMQPNKASMKERKGRPTNKSIAEKLIDNYFETYKNQGKGEPTLQDIRREEGRPLTVDEEERYIDNIRRSN